MCEKCAEFRRQMRLLQQEVEVLTSQNAVLRLRLDAGPKSETALKFYSVTEVGERLQISANTIKRFIREGKLRAWKDSPNGQLRIGHNDLVDFIAARTNEKIVTYEC